MLSSSASTSTAWSFRSALISPSSPISKRLMNGCKPCVFGSSDPSSPAAISQALAQLPMTLGDWDAEPKEVEDMDMALRQMMQGPYLLRQYVNRQTGSSVLVFITADRHGPLLVNHTPDGCY